MSFIDSVKYISQFAVVDEFGGRGEADKITKFYIVLRGVDEDGKDIEMTKEEAEEAFIQKKIVICNYLSSDEYTIDILAANPNNKEFILAGIRYINNTNIIVVGMGSFSRNASLSVELRNTDASVIASTTYLSDFASCFFLNKST